MSRKYAGACGEFVGTKDLFDGVGWFNSFFFAEFKEHSTPQPPPPPAFHDPTKLHHWQLLYSVQTNGQKLLVQVPHHEKKTPILPKLSAHGSSSNIYLSLLGNHLATVALARVCVYEYDSTKRRNVVLYAARFHQRNREQHVVVLIREGKRQSFFRRQSVRITHCLKYSHVSQLWTVTDWSWNWAAGG